MIWQCPLCAQPLATTSAGLGCPNNHQFDRAREGYVNLLPVQRKRSRAPGDSRAMLQARRQFLQQGGYQPLLDRLAELIAAEPGAASETFTLLDSGCGEGYYLSGLRRKLGAPQACGVDIAKDGVRLAAKADPALSLAVASSFELPVASASVDCLVRVFAPGSAEEVARVLKNNGLFVVVSPGPDHLQELKHSLLERVAPHRDPALEPGFRLVAEERLSFARDYSAETLQWLLAMMPLFWRSSPARQQALQACDEMRVSADFLLRCYRKSEPQGEQAVPQTAEAGQDGA